jgi:hypothetical protein
MANKSQPIGDVQKGAHRPQPSHTVTPAQTEPREPAPYHYSQDLQHKKDYIDASPKTEEDLAAGTEKGPACGHPGCNCAVEMGEHYCSDRCRQVAATPGLNCQCGHPECGGPLS